MPEAVYLVNEGNNRTYKLLPKGDDKIQKYLDEKRFVECHPHFRHNEFGDKPIEIRAMVIGENIHPKECKLLQAFLNAEFFAPHIQHD